MSKVLLDTDVLIEVLRGREKAKVFLRAITRDAVPCCSVISVAEICAGMYPEEQDTTFALLDALLLFPVTRQIAEIAGQLKRGTKSHKLELADCLIAATALVEGASLATGNIKDYPMKEITILPFRR